MPFSTSDGVTLWTTTTGTPSSAPPVVILTYAVRALAAHIPQHTFHLIPDAGHAPWREQPVLAREVVRSVV